MRFHTGLALGSRIKRRFIILLADSCGVINKYLMTMKQHRSGTASATTGVLFLFLSSCFLLAAVYIWFANDVVLTLIPLSTIPLLIFLMVQYVALRLYLRN